jgi:hypothetical protein
MDCAEPRDDQFLASLSTRSAKTTPLQPLFRGAGNVHGRPVPGDNTLLSNHLERHHAIQRGQQVRTGRTSCGRFSSLAQTFRLAGIIRGLLPVVADGGGYRARGPLTSLAGSITMLRNSPSTPSAAMPTSRNGIRTSQTRG